MDWPDGVTFVDGRDALDWIDARLGPGISIRSFVPLGFDAYVRVFHPAAHLKGSGEVRAVRWREVAEWSGRNFFPSSPFRMIAGPTFETDAFPFASPDEGLLDDETCATLIDVLSAYTKSPRSCVLAIWDGYGGIHDGVPPLDRANLAGRSYLIVSAPINLACRFPVSASYWWPADRAWVVTTDIDLDSTIIACSSAAANTLLADARLEALEISPDSRVDSMT